MTLEDLPGKSNIRKLDIKAGAVMHAGPPLGQLRQEHFYNFKVRLSYIARHLLISSQPSLHLILKQTKNAAPPQI